jgi:putative ABC transport system substrate-binding protein
VRRIGILNTTLEDDPEWRARRSAFEQELGKMGWIEERNVRFERRWSSVDPSDIRAHAAELVASAPDVIVTSSNLATTIVGRQTRTIPIVFTTAGDPVGTGLVSSMARPGGNMTGFTRYEIAMGGKWLQLLKEIAPRINRVAVIYTPGGAGSEGLLHTIEVLAPSLGVHTTAIPARDPPQIEREISAFSADPDSGLISLTGPNVTIYREHILAAATRHRLPAIYPGRYYVTNGGLMSYAADGIEVNRHAASYVDRILRGEKPGDLPVQFPTKFEMVVNRKTATALGLAIPPSILLRADEVIE